MTVSKTIRKFKGATPMPTCPADIQVLEGRGLSAVAHVWSFVIVNPAQIASIGWPVKPVLPRHTQDHGA